MTLPRCIFFDCINTLIGVHDQESYWMELARDGVTAGLFLDEDSFVTDYLADLTKRRQDPTHSETSLTNRLLSLDGVNTALADEEKVALADALAECFARRYLEGSFVLPGVSDMLDAWRDHAIIGVVSDFFLAGLPRRLLEHHGLLERVTFVIDSCEVGWRKPSPRIYQAALHNAGIEQNQASKVLFIGDTPRCDVDGPRAFGMQALWYGLDNPNCDLSDWCTFRPNR